MVNDLNQGAQFAVTYDKKLSFLNPLYIVFHSECAYRVVLHIPNNSVQPVPPPKFCPNCGCEATSISSEWINQDIFDLMALDYNLDRDIVKAIYDLWEPAEGDPINFGTFLKNSIEQALES